jgi:CDP-glucose 4,6-dehydratase
MNLIQDFWKNKRVFLTGHTGFKGTWMTLLLESFGAKVTGFSLEPNTDPSFFNIIKNNLQINSVIGDIRDFTFLEKTIKNCKPEIIIHMAAQPLVRRSYDDPIETYSTNVMGLVNLFVISKKIKCLKAIINITSDKCYENNEWVWGYRESDRVGGHDPYSNSKACSEIVTNSFRKSFFNDLNIGLATARAGNVIGGGDWSKDRLVPDYIRAWQANKTLVIRNPNAIRPWQHVLEPLTGYLILCQELYKDFIKYNGAWNFGPNDLDMLPVKSLINIIQENLPNKAKVEFSKAKMAHEAKLLRLDSSKSKNFLRWKDRWSVNEALKNTLDWYRAYYSSQPMHSFSMDQINNYFKS